MRINVESEDKRIKLALPSGLIYRIVFSGVGLKCLKRYGGDNCFSNITKKDMKKIRKTIRRMRKIHKSWNIVEVDSAEGDHIVVRL